MSLFNIDSYFQKDFRLRTLNQWDWKLFQEKLGNSIEFGIVVGVRHSGKTTVANMLNKQFGIHVISMAAIKQKIIASLSTEDEPFEGEVKQSEIDKEVLSFIHTQVKKGKGERVKFVFDGFTHATG